MVTHFAITVIIQTRFQYWITKTKQEADRAHEMQFGTQALCGAVDGKQSDLHAVVEWQTAHDPVRECNWIMRH